MPYPAKTDRDVILATAIAQVAERGRKGLSLRALASELNLAPNALYRYFPNRAHLETALADEGARRLHAILRRSVGKKSPQEGIRSIARAYLKFARDEPALYESLLAPGTETEGAERAHKDLWSFVLQQVGQIADQSAAPQAAVALWAFLHGLAGLEAARVLGRGKPASAFEYGLEAWLARAGATAGQVL